MQHCMMAETQYLEASDPNGYFDEGMIPRNSVIIYLKENPFSDREIEVVRANEKRVFEFGSVVIRTWTTEMSQLEMMKHFRCPISQWDDVKDWIGK
jgi:hypothetical protein